MVLTTVLLLVLITDTLLLLAFATYSRVPSLDTASPIGCVPTAIVVTNGFPAAVGLITTTRLVAALVAYTR